MRGPIRSMASAAIVPNMAASAALVSAMIRLFCSACDQEGVGERLAIPCDREAGELAGIAAGIEGKQHHQRDRRIEEQIDGEIRAHASDEIHLSCAGESPGDAHGDQ